MGELVKGLNGRSIATLGLFGQSLKTQSYRQ